MKLETNELSISKERVIEAAGKCPQAETILKTLFPEVFKEDKFFDLLRCQVRPGNIDFAKIYDGYFAEVYRSNGDELHGKAIFLSDTKINWELQKKGNYYLLIPTRK